MGRLRSFHRAWLYFGMERVLGPMRERLSTIVSPLGCPRWFCLPVVRCYGGVEWLVV